MQPGNTTDDMFPANGQDFDMVDLVAAEDYEKRCKKPCMNVVTDHETYDMAFVSFDMLYMSYTGLQVPIAPYADMGALLTHQEVPQVFPQQFTDPSTWEMDLVSALDEDMVIRQSSDPVMAAYHYPHDGPFFPPSQQSQDEDLPYRPREPLGVVDFPAIITQLDFPPSRQGGLFPDSNCPTIDPGQIGQSLEVYLDPLCQGHEQWESTGISPMTMSQECLGISLIPDDLLAPATVLTLGTPISDTTVYGDASHRGVVEDHQNPSSTSAGQQHDADWDNDATYRGIPPQARDMLFYTLLRLNDSFADLIYLQWLEVVENYAFRPCRDVFAEYPTIRGLATMFNLRMSEDEDAPHGEEDEEEQVFYAPATHADNDVDRCDSGDNASPAATAGDSDDGDVEMQD